MNEQFKPATLVDPAGTRVAARTKDEADRLFASGYKLETQSPPDNNFQSGNIVKDNTQGSTPVMKSPLTDWKNKTKVIDFIKEGLKLKNNLDSDINQANLYWRTKYEDPSSFTDERFQYMSPGEQANVRNARDAAASAQLQRLADEKEYRATGISDILAKTSGVMEDARLAEEMAMNKESSRYDNMYKAAQARKAMDEAGINEEGDKIYRGVTSEQILNAIAGAEGNVPYEYSDSGRSEKGRYQFMPETWAKWSAEYNAVNNEMSGLLPMTKENQDAVAKWKVEQWMDAGYSPQQIAAMWNSGKATWKGRRGISTITGEPYDVEDYVKRFTGSLDNAYGGSPDEEELALSTSVKAGVLKDLNIAESEAEEFFGRKLTESDWIKLQDTYENESRVTDEDDAVMYAKKLKDENQSPEDIFIDINATYGRDLNNAEIQRVMRKAGYVFNERLKTWSLK